MNRRIFINTTAGAGAATALSARAASPNEKIVVAAMGMGGRGMTLASEFDGMPNVEVKTVCDVDSMRVDYAAHVVGQVNGRKIRTERDFRRVLEDKDVDVLVVASSNHWHAPATLLAASAGKHVYVEKPCSHNPREGELMIEAARKHNVRIQQGSQRRSRPGQIEGIQKLREGAIGRVYYAHCYMHAGRPGIGTGKETQPPKYLDYDLWQGPAPRVPYRDNVLHYNWHWFWHWGNGELGNHGAHKVDVAQWGLGVDYPIQVSSTGGRFHWNDDQETPDTQVASFKFPGEKMITWEATSANPHKLGDRRLDLSFFGDQGSMAFSATGYVIYDEKNREIESGNGNGGQADHLRNFIDAVRGQADLNAEIEIAHKSTLLCHLGNIAYRTGQTLDCNLENGRILNSTDAKQLWSREYEPGWEPSV